MPPGPPLPGMHPGPPPPGAGPLPGQLGGPPPGVHPSAARLNDLLEFVKAEFEQVAGESGSLKAQREEYEAMSEFAVAFREGQTRGREGAGHWRAEGYSRAGLQRNCSCDALLG